MDLLDFSAEELYFDQPLEPRVEALLATAAEAYAEGDSELPILRAYFLQPDHLMVQVALYRFFYYQHRYEEALRVAERTMGCVASELGIRADWPDMSLEDLGFGVQRSMTLMRFYLFALKGAGYLELRLDRPQQALRRFEKVLELDTADRIGVTALRDLARSAVDEADAMRAAG